MRRTIIVLALAMPCLVRAEVTFSYDFEQATDLKQYPALSFDSRVKAEIVPGGADGQGHCLQVTTLQPDKFCPAGLKLDLPMAQNLVLSLDHRESCEAGKTALYFAALFFGPQDSQWFASDKFSDQWRHMVVVPAEMHSPSKSTLTLDTVLSRLNLYGRAPDTDPARMTVWLDNIRLETAEPQPRQSDKQRTSFTALPLFHWGRGLGKVRLEISPEPSFPPGKTTAVETERNWYVPPQPLAPGAWHWRLYMDTPLLRQTTPSERTIVPAEAHRYVAPPLPLAELKQRPHPRLIAAAAAGDDREKQELVKRAQSLYRQGIPADPPVYAPGHPDWPTWIDWYGKVHGRITSSTGVRLKEMAELYARTRDPRVRDWLKEMALKVAAWDPVGGSGIKGGDIGFQYVLRGLNWAYDALHEDLTPEERETLRGMLIRRAQIFWDNLNPFRFGREYNNHAWLCGLALEESGLLLAGEYPPAEEWAQYVYDLYCSLFLCGLGYQGDNNEGIAYWGYGLMFVVEYADMMKHVCGVDLYQHPWLHDTARFPMYTVPPGAWAVSFADTGKPNHGVFGPAETARVKGLALRTKDPYALWYAGGSAEEAGFEPKPPLDLPQSIFYRFIGWGVFNTSLLSGAEGVTVAMRSGPYWAGHQHEDLNSFVINAYGEKLAIDSGYYDWYGSEHFNKYSTLTRAHNAILVNGLDQKSRHPGCDGVMKEWFDSPGFGYMVGRMPYTAAGAPAPEFVMYEGALKQWDRRMLFIKPGLVIVHDVLEAAQAPAQYDWLLHSVAPIEIDAKAQAFSFTSGKASLSGRFLIPADVELKVVKGYPVEPVDGYSTRPVPPEKYAHEWTLWATPREKRQGEEILAAIQIARASGEKAGFEPLRVTNGVGVATKAEGEITAVLLRREGADATVSTDGVTAQAGVAVVACGLNEAPRRALCLGGTKLRGAGVSFLESNTPVDFAWVDNELGEIVTIRAEKPARIVTALNLRGTPDLSKAAGVKIRPVKGLWELQVPAGEHEIVWPRQAAAAVAGEGIKLTHYTLPVGTKATHYWWGGFDAPSLAHYELALQSAAPASLSLDGKPVDLSGGERLWLKPGRHTVLISGPATAPRIRLTPHPPNLMPTTMLPQDYRPGAGAIVIEAEQPVSEGRVKGQIMEKVGASGKVAHCVWDTDGQWATWKFSVPRDGDYRLLIRGCGDDDGVLRLLQIDPPDGQGVYEVSLTGTGGWARDTDDWRYFAVPAKLSLKAGEHTLKLQRLDGSMNVDCFVIEPTP